MLVSDPSIIVFFTRPCETARLRAQACRLPACIPSEPLRIFAVAAAGWSTAWRSAPASRIARTCAVGADSMCAGVTLAPCRIRRSIASIVLVDSRLSSSNDAATLLRSASVSAPAVISRGVCRIRRASSSSSLARKKIGAGEADHILMATIALLFLGHAKLPLHAAPRNPRRDRGSVLRRTSEHFGFQHGPDYGIQAVLEAFLDIGPVAQ